jgi:hypothetical protein
VDHSLIQIKQEMRRFYDQIMWACAEVKALKEVRNAASAKEQHIFAKPTMISAKPPVRRLSGQEMPAPARSILSGASAGVRTRGFSGGAPADAKTEKKKQNFQPPDRNFNSFDVLAGKSKRPFRSTRSVGNFAAATDGSGGTSSGAGGSSLVDKPSMTKEDVLVSALCLELKCSNENVYSSNTHVLLHPLLCF